MWVSGNWRLDVRVKVEEEWRKGLEVRRRWVKVVLWCREGGYGGFVVVE